MFASSLRMRRRLGRGIAPSPTLATARRSREFERARVARGVIGTVMPNERKLRLPAPPTVAG